MTEDLETALLRAWSNLLQVLNNCPPDQANEMRRTLASLLQQTPTTHRKETKTHGK